MPRYAAFLRGINVGGHRVTGPELCGLLEGIGLEDVRSFRASGNLVFEAGRERPATLERRIESALAKGLGYESATFVRSAKEVLAIAAGEPFGEAQVAASKGKLQVVFLREAPDAAARKRCAAAATGRDLLAVGERELYWLPVAGTQDSDLDMAAFGDLGGENTMRTKGTVELIAAKFFG